MGGNRTGSRGLISGWPEGLQDTGGPWGSRLASYFLPLRTPEHRVVIFFLAFPSFLMWTAFLDDFRCENGPYLLPVWGTSLYWLQGGEGPL